MMFTVYLTSLSYALRSRVWLAFTLIMPLLFFTAYVAISPGNSADTPQLPVLVLDDAHNAASQRLMASLQADPTLMVTTQAAATGRSALEQAEAAVIDGTQLLAVVILRDFAATGGDAGKAAQLKVFAGKAFPGAAAVLWTTLQRHAMSALPDALSLWSKRHLQRWVGELSAQQKRQLEQRLVELANSGAGMVIDEVQRQSSIVTVDIEDLSGRSAGDPLVALYAAALGLMCMLFAGSNAGGSVLEEKYLGTLDRILASRASMNDLLIGKLMYAVTLGCLQFLLLFAWAGLWFKLQLFQHIGGMLVILIPTAVCCGAFGLMLSLRCRDRIMQGFVSIIVIMILSFVGGGMVPRVFMSETLQDLSLVAFNAWAIEGFTKVFWHHASVLELWPQVLALLVFTVLFLLRARYLARRWEFA